MNGGMSIGTGLGLDRLAGGSGGGPAPLKILLFTSSTGYYYFRQGTGPDNPNVTSSTDGVTFSRLNGVGVGACTLGDYLNQALGRPIKMIDQTHPGMKVSDIAANTNGWRTAMTSAAAAAGGVDAVVLLQMFNDVRDASSVTGFANGLATYQAAVAAVRSALSSPNLPIFVMGSQKLNDGDATRNQQAIWAKMAETQICDETNNYLYVQAYDLPQEAVVPSIHLTDAGLATHATRGGKEMRAFFQGTTTRQFKLACGYTPLNTPTQAAPAGWNTFGGGSPAGGSPVGTVSNLLDTNGVATPFSVTPTDVGEGTNTLGSTSGLGPWPAAIVQFNLVDSTTNKEITLTYGGFDDTKVYDLKRAASRSLAGVSRNVNCSVNGGTVLTADVLNNTGTLARFPGIVSSGGVVTTKVVLGPGQTVAAYLAGDIWTERAF